MKKFLLTVLSLALIMAVSCTKEENSENSSTTSPEEQGQQTFSNGLLPGEFSVSNTKKVKFSQGNLQYTTTGSHAVASGGSVSGTWRFAEHQWDTIGSANNNKSSTYTGWIDLFSWATSGYHNPNDPYNIFYKPYDRMVFGTGGDDEYNVTGFGPSLNMADLDLTGTSANYDWGVYNAISNGGNQPGLWRTLTKDEWFYLINTRSGTRYAMAIVNGVSGIIIVPDNWSSSYTLHNVNRGDISFSSNVISATQWYPLENAGCVFLPAAGAMGWSYAQQGGKDYDKDYNCMGTYWTSTHSENVVDGLKGDSFMLYFEKESFGQELGITDYYRSHGLSVRLVQDVQ